MKLRTVTFPKSRRESRRRPGIRRGRAGALVALAAALPLAFGLASPAPAEAFTANSPTGIDVSKWQRPGGVKLDWKKVAAAGEKFAFIKATDGKDGLSPFFAEDSKAAHEAGLIIGSYHKAHPDRDAIVQADAYAAALKQQPSGARTLPPVLDLELDAGMTPAALEKWASAFLKRVELQTGQTPMIYTYRWFWVSKMADTKGLNGYPLWLAAYQDQPPTDIPGGWDKATFWQRSSTGSIPGIPTPVDLNTYNGSVSQLEGLSRGDAAGKKKDDGKTGAEVAGADRAKAEDDTGVGPDAVSPPSGRAAPGAGSLDTGSAKGDGAKTGDDKTGGTTGDSKKDESGTGATGETGKSGNDGATTGDDATDGTIGGQNDDGTIGGDGTTAPDSPLATSELIDAIIDAIKSGSDGADFSDSIAAVREAAEAAGLDKDQIDTLIAFLEQAINSGNVPEGQLEEIGKTAPPADETGDATTGGTGNKTGDANGDKAGDKAATGGTGKSERGADGGKKSPAKPSDVRLFATYSDVVALLAGASR